MKKQMDLTLRYWSVTCNEVWITYHTSLFFGHAEGEKVAKKIYEQLVSDRLLAHKMASLIRDGPNVNKTIFWKMNKLITQENPEFPGLVDLGSHSIHVIHSVFGKDLEHHIKEIDQLCMDLHSLFKYSAAKCEDLRQIQIEMEVEPCNFQQHTEVRWLSVGPPIKKMIEQYEAVSHFVVKVMKDS